MNMRNIHVITARSVPDKRISDDFIHAVLSNCTTRIVLPAPEKFSPELLPSNFNMAAVGVMKKGMSMSLFVCFLLPEIQQSSDNPVQEKQI